MQRRRAERVRESIGDVPVKENYSADQTRAALHIARFVHHGVATGRAKGPMKAYFVFRKEKVCLSLFCSSPRQIRPSNRNGE